MARPVIGICAAVERARWGVWDQDAFLIARTYVAAIQEAGGLAIVLPPDQALIADPDDVLDLLDGLLLAGGRHRPRRLRRRCPSGDEGLGPGARHVRDRADAPRARARPPAARHLPRHAADERRARRDARTAPARQPRAPRPP